MYFTKLSRQGMKKDTSARVVASTGSDAKNYSAMRVHMSSLKTDSSERNKIGNGSDNQNYSANPPKMPMGKESGGNRVVSTHGK